jgi:hypothetical protein
MTTRVWVCIGNLLGLAWVEFADLEHHPKDRVDHAAHTGGHSHPSARKLEQAVLKVC